MTDRLKQIIDNGSHYALAKYFMTNNRKKYRCTSLKKYIVGHLEMTNLMNNK